MIIMKRTQIYLTTEQHEFLENLAFYLSRKENKKTTISELIRQAIGNLQAKYGNIKEESLKVIINRIRKKKKYSKVNRKIKCLAA